MSASPLTVSGFYSMVEPELKDLFEEACDEMDLECSICYEPFKDPYLITVCQHVFCQICINTWKAKTCPLCRQKFTKEQVVKDSFKQQSINNVLERCKKDLKAASEKSEKSPVPLNGKKVVSISSSSSSSSSSSQPIETSNVKILQRSVEEETVPISMKHKFGQMIQFIFSEIAEDQSIQSSQRCTFKTEWSAQQKMKYQTTREYWSSFHSGRSNYMSDYLDALENVAFGLADILKDQIKTLKLSGNSSRERVKHVYSEGGGTIERSHGGSTITFHGGADSSMDLSRIMTLMRNRDSSNFSAPEENCQIFVGGQEVRRSEANFIRALCHLDSLLSECFSLRYARNEFANCFKALEKISPESVEKQNDALISLCDYCNSLLQEENLQELLDHFNTLSLEKNGPPVLSKIAENLISVDSSNKEKIQVIITSLEEQSITSIKNHITQSFESNSFGVNSIKLLYLCEQHKKWCLKVVCQAIEGYINKGNEEEATQLINKYLLKKPETHAEGMKYIRQLVERNMPYDSTATKLIDKYFLKKPETHAEGMKCIRQLVERNMPYDSTATKLIDKYFLKKPETHAEGMKYIRQLVERNMPYDSTATKLIDKYFLKKPETYAEGMRYIRQLVERNMAYESTATKLIDKYFLKKQETHAEGIQYIRRLIDSNRNYPSTVNELRKKYQVYD